MSSLDHPYEMEQIENLNKVDQAKYLAQNLQILIDHNNFSDEDEKKNVETNLKCLQVYQFQQELRSEVLANYMAN
jgi:hypothetical protein